MSDIGVDITRISRFKNPTNSFLKKVLHPQEILEYQKSKNKERFLASRWAVKEALFKANNDFFHFNQIKLEKNNRTFSVPGYIITTSSEDNKYYIAFVLRRNNEAKS